jgi:tetratricopeptide (TPR) repeat protein
MKPTRIAVLLLACSLWPLASCAPSGERLLARAEQQMAAGEYRAAMIDLRNYLSKNPGDAHARALLGLALLKQGYSDEATVEVRKAKEAGAVPSDTLVVDCGLMFARNEHQKVLDECTLPAADDAHLADIAITRGDALLKLQRYEEARGSFEAALHARPEDLDALGGLAEATLRADGTAAHAGGIEAARKVMAAAPDSVRGKLGYWLTLGSIEPMSRPKRHSSRPWPVRRTMSLRWTRSPRCTT